MRVGLGVILASGAHLHLEMKIGLEIRRRYRLDCSSYRVSSYQLISWHWVVVGMQSPA
jgi:hypothetical protein